MNQARCKRTPPHPVAISDGRIPRRCSGGSKKPAVAGWPATAQPGGASTQTIVKALRDAGVRIVTLTGDGKTTAEAVRRELGI